MHSRRFGFLLPLTALTVSLAIFGARGRSAAHETARILEQNPAGAPPHGQLAADRHGGGLLAFDVTDTDTGQPIPCKLTFVGVEGTPKPSFTHNDIGRPEGELAIAAFERVFSAVGSESVRVPTGTYDIYVSRGPEWDVSVSRKVKIGPES